MSLGWTGHLFQWETWFASLISQIPCQPCQPHGWSARHRHRVAEEIHSITLPEIITLNCQPPGFLSGLLGKRYFWKTTKSVCSSGTASSFEEHWCCKEQLYQLANVGHSSDLGPFPDSSQERVSGFNNFFAFLLYCDFCCNAHSSRLWDLCACLPRK